MEAAAQQPPGCCAGNLRARAFRLNPDCELVLFDQLSVEQQKTLSALRQDPSFYGLVRWHSATGLGAKAVSNDTAALLQALKEPGCLPDSAFDEPGTELATTQLVWDGVLQIARDREWLCGPAACSLTSGDSIAEQRALANLSLQAIKHAAALRATSPMELSGHLYRYNTLPLTPQWLRRIPDQAALQEYLQIQTGGRNRRELDASWSRVLPAAEQGAWLAWTSPKTSGKAGAITYKLYLSPLPSQLRDAFRIWLAAITRAGAFHFKMGSGVRGLLRPDKMVAYFGDRKALEEAAELIAKELSGCPAQGVPFTAEVNCGALMSWGADPPTEETVPTWLRRQSWRQWVCNRLGAALAVAKHYESDAMPVWRFALERLRLDGVDVSSWAPVSTEWQLQSAEEVALI
ncbi:MAG: hypothetical protein WBW69_19590 [Candidatus Korobacteraceae bacterium]